jgi:hypothetical protein
MGHVMVAALRQGIVAGAMVCLRTLSSSQSIPPAPDVESANPQSVQRAAVQYAQVIGYLRRAGLHEFVDGDVVSHGVGNSFHVTFRFAVDDKSKTRILSILENTRLFYDGPLGPGHVKDVGAVTRADALDFRSVPGVLGPRSLEVMINRRSFWGYADIDRFNLYGGLAPAFAHVFFELVPHWLTNP